MALQSLTWMQLKLLFGKHSKPSDTLLHLPPGDIDTKSIKPLLPRVVEEI